jgi:hypothetical protein
MFRDKFTFIDLTIHDREQIAEKQAANTDKVGDIKLSFQYPVMQLTEIILTLDVSLYCGLPPC